ncbi:hypothetical protein CC77DRAFT_1013697 [Alternaria alternata]|jgi:hypothetical protein|uniref:Uncharacterized protein n=1 Tax=Alternaria alternata TaxID=5599 RepID=A0A177D6I6_ALTAL|nr:hypothetical protein CC77DRAFT_1013697 [Alternaria alternata]OAG14887.1 hypothetical protein CC77DRAFT_1013697 [Alternaria alternata]RII18039.1 hypothetical protein CUC08_Gglean002127 [Alternaria sp. MG1]
MPLSCAANCRFCEFERVHDDAASPSQKEDNAPTGEGDVMLSSSSSSLPGDSDSTSSILETIFAETIPTYTEIDDASNRMDIAPDMSSKGDDEEKEDPHTSIHPPSPSSVYSNDNPLENDNTNSEIQGSDDWSFLDDVHVAIVAWLDAGGLEMARPGYAPVFATGMGGKGRRRHSV